MLLVVDMQTARLAALYITPYMRHSCALLCKPCLGHVYAIGQAGTSIRSDGVDCHCSHVQVLNATVVVNGVVVGLRFSMPVFKSVG